MILIFNADLFKEWNIKIHRRHNKKGRRSQQNDKDVRVSRKFLHLRSVFYDLKFKY